MSFGPGLHEYLTQFSDELGEDYIGWSNFSGELGDNANLSSGAQIYHYNSLNEYLLYLVEEIFSII